MAPWKCKYCDFKTLDGPVMPDESLGKCPKCGKPQALIRFDPDVEELKEAIEFHEKPDPERDNDVIIGKYIDKLIPIDKDDKLEYFYFHFKKKPLKKLKKLGDNAIKHLENYKFSFDPFYPLISIKIDKLHRQELLKILELSIELQFRTQLMKFMIEELYRKTETMHSIILSKIEANKEE